MQKNNKKNSINKKLNIVISSYDDLSNPYYGGGGARAVHEIARRLTTDYSVTVITSAYNNSENKKIDEVNYRRIGTTRFGARTSQLIFHLLLPYYCRKEKFDIWIESFTPPHSTSFLPLFTDKPVVGLVHMLSGHEMARKYKIPFYIIESLGLRFYKKFIVPHQNIKGKILQHSKQADIEIISNGVNLPKTSKNFSLSKKYISYVGRIECSQKGLDLLINAYKKIHTDIPQILAIAGAGTKAEELKLQKLVNQSGLSDKIVLLGKLKDDQVYDLMQKSSMVMLPSRFETYSLVALEALANQLPVVSFDIDGFKWLPKDASLKVSAYDYTAMAVAIKTISQDEKLRKKMGQNAHKFSKKYSWDIVAKQYQKYIENCLKYEISN